MEPISQEKPSLREKLLSVGVEELYQHGFANFSVRRIADRCGVSCAAPYKHFSDKQVFIDEIFVHINQQWLIREQTVLEQQTGNPREKLLAICMAYIHFLIDNPHFRAILMSRYEPSEDGSATCRTAFSQQTARLVEEYIRCVPMDHQTRQRKLYVTRSLIYGAALLIGTGEMEHSGENLRMIRSCIEREFDLP